MIETPKFSEFGLKGLDWETKWLV